jgi:hypothetical protein
MVRIWILVLVASAGLALGGCASMGGGGGGGDEAAAKPTTAEAAPPKGVAPPASSPLAKVSTGMTASEVRGKLGEPTGESTYPTGKNWIPFYYGPDTMRTDWKYKGQGRVVFSHNQYSGAMKVIRIDYDPNEDGQ